MNEESIFSRALELEIGSEREQFLDSACGNDLAQRRKIERLLAEHANPDSFLIRGGAAGDGEVTESAPGQSIPTDSDRIGAYRLLHRLGEGGMGTVYLAEQQQPVRRRVAVKVIKQGMNTRQFIARFEAERQALAMMDHPNIAKVLDAGCTEDGRPYFVMELVKGIPITEFCDQNRLPTTQRLELFVHVCQAVQHAHQKGIIHRDLKPSNVLVAMYDNQPVPKVIDFGVAKATHQPLTEHTLCTIPGQIVGTWEYMSPEQAILNQLDVDTRTDIYSLGVILYELLTGKTPLDLKSLKPEALEERLRRIREEEPSRPSLRVSSLGQAAASMAAYRNTESDSLSRSLRGDLDWIVMKALDKDRSRRYETATGFATEINRYLNDEPLSFRPPSTWDQLGRFCRRNKSLAVTLASISAALVFGASLASWGYLRSTAAFAQVERINAELEERNAELQTANEQQRLNQLSAIERSKERFMLAVVSGNRRDAAAQIDEVKELGAEEEWLCLMNGVLLLHDGKYAEAVAELEIADGLLRDNVTAYALLTLAYLWAGDEDKYYQRHVHLQGMKPTDFMGRLAKGWAQIRWFVDDAIAELEAARTLRPDSSVALLLHARAYRMKAMEEYDRGRSIELASNAISEIKSLQDLMPKNPRLLAELLHCYVILVDRAEAQDTTTAANTEIIHRLAKDLEEHIELVDAQWALLEYWAWLDNDDQIGWLVNELERRNATISNYFAITMMSLNVRRGQWDAAVDWFDRTDAAFDRVGTFFRQYVEIFRSKTDSERRKIASGFMAEVEQRRKTSAGQYGVFDWTVMRLLHDDRAADIAREYRAACEALPFTDQGYIEITEFMLGRHSPEQLAAECTKRTTLAEAMYVVAIDCLARGEREKAIHYFDRVVDTKYRFLYVYYWSRAFSDRLKDRERDELSWLTPTEPTSP